MLSAAEVKNTINMASVKVKFRKSTMKNKEGVLCFQLIHLQKSWTTETNNTAKIRNRNLLLIVRRYVGQISNSQQRQQSDFVGLYSSFWSRICPVERNRVVLRMFMCCTQVGDSAVDKEVKILKKLVVLRNCLNLTKT